MATLSAWISALPCAAAPSMAASGALLAVFCAVECCMPAATLRCTCSSPVLCMAACLVGIMALLLVSVRMTALLPATGPF